MNGTYDTAVIGGGIIGLSCGYYLSKREKRVVVLEAGGFADGASGTCDDMILFQSKKPGINLELAFESLELYRSLRGELEDDFGFENYGGMVLIENRKELEIMEEFLEQQRAHMVSMWKYWTRRRCSSDIPSWPTASSPPPTVQWIPRQTPSPSCTGSPGSG
jgi:glycine/D-amino acid oxidase-like deaminating enzyme